MKLRFHIRDKFGVDIYHSIDYDPETGVGHRYVPDSEEIIEYFKPGGYVEIDGHTNPTQKTLDAIYSSVHAGYNENVMHATIKQIEQDVRVDEGIVERH